MEEIGELWHNECAKRERKEERLWVGSRKRRLVRFFLCLAARCSFFPSLFHVMGKTVFSCKESEWRKTEKIPEWVGERQASLKRTERKVSAGIGCGVCLLSLLPSVDGGTSSHDFTATEIMADREHADRQPQTSEPDVVIRISFHV